MLATETLSSSAPWCSFSSVSNVLFAVVMQAFRGGSPATVFQGWPILHCGKQALKGAEFAGFAGEIYFEARFALARSGQTWAGSRFRTALIHPSWSGLHPVSFRFHQVTMVRSFHVDLAAWATISSVTRMPIPRAFALNSASNFVRSAKT